LFYKMLFHVPLSDSCDTLINHGQTDGGCGERVVQEYGANAIGKMIVPKTEWAMAREGGQYWLSGRALAACRLYMVVSSSSVAERLAWESK
jgi:hypothetical protein